MKIKANLLNKPVNFQMDDCQIEKVVELPRDQFSALVITPLTNQPFIAENKRWMFADDSAVHCLLVLGQGSGDGVLIYSAGYDYPRLAAYLPGMRDILNARLERAADFIVHQGTEATENGSWSISFKELEKQTEITVRRGNGLDGMLLEALTHRREVTSAALTDTGIDTAYHLNFCSRIPGQKPCYFTKLPEEQKTQLFYEAVETLLDFFGDENLYGVLHNGLQMPNEEILARGYLTTEATLRAIKSKLEAQGALNAIGKQEWTIKNLLSILSNEKYCGDALLQKTFIQDCISKKVIQNNGQLPKYLVQDHHEGIVSRDVFYAAQLEIARRRAQTGGTSKSAPTGRSKYSGKYILTNLMFCGHCGTGYRRCVWNKGGVKRAVWRCGSRLDYGAKYCKHSETLEEKPLQQAILNAINSVMDSRDALEVQLMGAMEQELAPIPGETMSLADIDRMLEELEKQFNSLLAEASAAGGTEDYAERFRMISNAMADLKEHKSRIKQVYQENELVSQRLKAASIAMSAYAAELTEWDQSVVYQLVEKVTVLAKDKIRVTFRNGTEVEQEIEQLDWRNAS